MKKNIFTILFFLTAVGSAQIQMVPEFQKPKTVTETSKEELLQSRIFIPVEINQSIFKDFINESTPNSLSSKVVSDVRDLQVRFKVSNGKTKFNRSEVVHKLILDKDLLTYQSRTKVSKSWPFKGFKFTNWISSDCQEIKFDAYTNILLKFGANAEFTSVLDVITDIDKLMCNQNDLAGLATLLKYQDYKILFKYNLDKKLALYKTEWVAQNGLTLEKSNFPVKR